MNIENAGAGNHYETLGIEKTATGEDVKRAYYRKVRQYQPDRFPEEFKKIRAAYEVLSGPEQRAEYDALGELPESVAPLLREAGRLFMTGKEREAFGIYRQILESHPGLDVVRERYADALEMDNKKEKAAGVWKELCARQPGNALYARKLCECYLHAGRNKKALAEMRRALELDDKSIEGWMLFIICSFENAKGAGDVLDMAESVLGKALRAVEPIKTGEWKKIQMYAYAFSVTCPVKYDVSAGYLREAARLIRENGREGQESGKTAFEMIMEVPIDGLGKFYPELKTIAGLLPDSATGPFSEDMDGIKLRYEIERLTRKGFSGIFYDLFRILTAEFPQKDDRIETVAIEYALLRERLVYNPQIKRLKAEFPELYALHKTFFNGALTGDPDTMKRLRSMQLEEYDRKFGAFDDKNTLVLDTAPVRREEPKIGRNDPCPCGSGKKYKKCCGA